MTRARHLTSNPRNGLALVLLLELSPLMRLMSLVGNETIKRDDNGNPCPSLLVSQLDALIRYSCGIDVDKDLYSLQITQAPAASRIRIEKEYQPKFHSPKPTPKDVLELIYDSKPFLQIICHNDPREETRTLQRVEVKLNYYHLPHLAKV